MLFSKTQIEVIAVFASKIAEKFSIRQVSGLIKKPYPLVHRSVTGLLKNNALQKDSHGLLSLNYRDNHADLAYIESLRKERFLEKNKTVSLFAKDVYDSLKGDFFILLIFGSSAAGKKKPRDIDVLLVVPEAGQVAECEKILSRISSDFTLGFDCNVVSSNSAREMLSRRGEPNVMNETLNNHIILFGAENYYRMLRYAG